MPRKVTFKDNGGITKCPKCSYRTSFTVYSRQVAEDYCNIWAVCVCGFDPTEDNTGDRIEDVWGGTSDEDCINAISITWNETLEGMSEQFTPQTD